MKKSEIFIFQIILAVLMLVGGYGILAFIGFLMHMNIPIPVLIIGFCYLFYKILRKEICQ